jgi:adenine-specific DNA methylase
MEKELKEYVASFIETQFPVSKISKECYKERKSGRTQVLTGFGKWWGRKPLFLVRAILIGLLMPASDNPKRDRDIFLKLLTMDDEGLHLRKNKSIDINVIFTNLTFSERQKYFLENQKVFKKEVSNEDKKYLQKLVFERLSYDEKLTYCLCPSEVAVQSIYEWNEINNHLNTNSFNVQDLIQELAIQKFGKIPIVGDCFCGGGSIPFEAARLGLNIFASELNPIAMLLTISSLKQNTLNEKKWRCKYYLYCLETVCPECGFKVPLAPSWFIDKGTNTIAILIENNYTKSFDINIRQNTTLEEINLGESLNTIKDSKLFCPHCKKSTPITSIRKDKKKVSGLTDYGLRRWAKNDLIPEDTDIFTERLYCLKYIEKFNNKTWEEFIKKPAPTTDSTYGKTYYLAPSDKDLLREQKVLEILKNKFSFWQEKGFIPYSKIVEGEKTSELIRTRGWTYWHQLFNPRQLLMLGLLMEFIDEEAKNIEEKIIGLLGVNRCCDFNSKLSNWNGADSRGINSFYNQALNTLFNYSCRTISSIYTSWMYLNYNIFSKKSSIDFQLTDARNINSDCDIWITDPPYADAVNYHELSEFFLAWDKKMLKEIFPDWYTDSKRALAVKGSGEDFNKSMIEIYKNLNNHMPDNGVQVVMFTHQSVKVWAELTLILWQAGLQVVSAWDIATETESGGLKQGNYVKGTVILVLKKQKSDKTSFLDELQPQIEQEVKQQIDSMRDIDDKDDPNFNDADYLLAAYAASLKVLTSYKNIGDIDINYELSKQRNENEPSKIVRIINHAVKIAYDYLIPEGFDQYNWRLLTPIERFYIKGMEIEKNGNYELSSYQELARGFGVKDYKDYIASVKANNARLKTATELGTRAFSQSTFLNTILRNIFLALNQAIKEENALNGKNWLRNELINYWNSRNIIIEILEFISRFEFIQNMSHWKDEAVYSKLIKELVRNDGI